MAEVEEPGAPGPGSAPGDVEADVARLLARHAPEQLAIEQALRATIRRAFPDAIEQVDFPDKLIAFGRSTKIRGLLFAIIAHTYHVNLQLADGADLPDPEGLVEGAGKRIRHVKIRTLEEAVSPAVAAIVRAQLAARRSA